MINPGFRLLPTFYPLKCPPPPPNKREPKFPGLCCFPPCNRLYAPRPPKKEPKFEIVAIALVLFTSQFELLERKKARSEYDKLLFRQEMEAEELRITSESALKELQQLQVSYTYTGRLYKDQGRLRVNSVLKGLFHLF